MTKFALQRNLCQSKNWNSQLICRLNAGHFGPHAFSVLGVDTVTKCNHLIASYPYDTGTICGRRKGHLGPHMEFPDKVQTKAGTIKVHSEQACSGPACVIHDPSAHKMRDWPMSFRFDKGALIERQCPHGVGHPDPDSLAYFERRGQAYMGVHGCDGCCFTD